MPFLKLYFRLEIDRSKFTLPKSPFIAICNHGSFMDFAITMLALYPRRMNAVAAQKFFYYSPLHWFLPMMGAIPKCLFDADVRAVVAMKKVLERGGNILLYPEGRCECDGYYAGMHKATGKLISRLKVPVVACSIDGAYNCMPFWRKGMRSGRVRIVLSNLFTADDLSTLSVDEVTAAADRRLRRDEDPQSRRPLGTNSKKRLAEGLHNIIYWCPVCGSEFATQTEGCVISCSACGTSACLDGMMNLTPLPALLQTTKPAISTFPGTVHDWYKAQARYEASKLTHDMKPLAVNVKVRLPSPTPGGGMETCGEGIMQMDSGGWHYSGTLRGGQADLHFPFSIVPALPIDPDDVFQIYAHGVFYCFVPKRPRECIKYSVIGECAYWKFEPSPYMTPRKDSGFC